MESNVTKHQEAWIDVLLEKVYLDSGHDFRDYRRGTVTRRLKRRMLATGVKTYIDYMRFLDSHPEEYARFADYLAIKVSQFFRSPYTFQQVSALVLPELLLHKRRKGERCLNFWSAGCARGEEPYSIAIMLADFLGRELFQYDITIYASDIGYLNLNQLRSGIYPTSDVEALPQSILDGYFLPDGDNYEVRPDIRQMVQFFHFDLTSAKRQPLPVIDCIFCCNVLIYFQRQLQERVLEKLYNSLAIPGYLVLGEVERRRPAYMRSWTAWMARRGYIKKLGQLRINHEEKVRMTQNATLPGDEISRKAGAIRTLSLLWLGTVAVGEVVIILIWLFNPFFIVLPLTLVATTALVIGVVSYWLCRSGRVNLAGYFFTIGIILFGSVVTPLFGGFAGPMAIIYVFAILVAGMAINIRASFSIAALCGALYLVTLGIESAGLLPSLTKPESEALVLPLLTVTVRVLFFFMAAFLSWFAASGLYRALQGVRSYAAELQAANEKLQASEEELKASNEELQATEEELRASNEELQEANAELKETQEQLIRSERLAAIGQLAGGVGHELRNPLGAIKNAIYYIRGKLTKSEVAEKEPRVLEFLDIVDDEVNTSNKIINDLLGFSRVGRPSVSPTAVKKIVDDALARVPIPENIELTEDLSVDSTKIKVDPGQIQQVLVNVITNAVQAMPEGGKLTISTREKEGFLELDITDTGSGIADEIKGKIFDPLFTTRAKGIGLGLAVSKSIIERHSGKIEAKSKAGKGITFTIRLPLEMPAQEGSFGTR